MPQKDEEAPPQNEEPPPRGQTTCQVGSECFNYLCAPRWCSKYNAWYSQCPKLERHSHYWDKLQQDWVLERNFKKALKEPRALPTPARVCQPPAPSAPPALDVSVTGAPKALFLEIAKMDVQMKKQVQSWFTSQLRPLQSEWKSIRFPPSMGKEARHIAYQIAGGMGLVHSSRGSGSDRRLCVTSAGAPAQNQLQIYINLIKSSKISENELK